MTVQPRVRDASIRAKIEVVLNASLHSGDFEDELWLEGHEGLMLWPDAKKTICFAQYSLTLKVKDSLKVNLRRQFSKANEPAKNISIFIYMQQSLKL